MKYMTKIEWILADEDFMKTSEDVSKKMEIARKKKTEIGKKFGNTDEWRIVNNQIRKKLKNSVKTKGICACDDDFLCKHRKKYIKEAFDGKAK